MNGHDESTPLTLFRPAPYQIPEEHDRKHPAILGLRRLQASHDNHGHKPRSNEERTPNIQNRLHSRWRLPERSQAYGSRRRPSEAQHENTRRPYESTIWLKCCQMPDHILSREVPYSEDRNGTRSIMRSVIEAMMS